MAYVGRGLTTGANYQKLDTISINGVTTFTMQVNSTAVTPAAEHVILAVNGVIQEPNVGFTVSGSTCTLASAIDNDGGTDTIWGVIAGNAAYVNNEFNTASFDVLSSTTSKPVFTLKNTHNGGTSAELQFNNTEAGGAGADGDDLGRVTFYGQDDGSNNQQFGEILCEIADASAGAEGGKMSLGVASHDGEMGNYGLIMTDGSAEDEIDVTIGAGTSSVTTIAGDLAVTGNGQGWVEVSQITLTSAGPFTFSLVFDSTYDIYMATLKNLHIESGADGTTMNMLYDIGGLQTGTYYGYHSQIVEGNGDGYAAMNDRDATSIALVNDMGDAAGETTNGIIYFYAPSSTDRIKTSSAHIFTCNTGVDPRGGTSHHNFTNSTSAMTGFKLDIAHANDFDAGTVTVYGLKN